MMDGKCYGPFKEVDKADHLKKITETEFELCNCTAVDCSKWHSEDVKYELGKNVPIEYVRYPPLRFKDLQKARAELGRPDADPEYLKELDDFKSNVNPVVPVVPPEPLDLPRGLCRLLCYPFD